MLLSLCDSHALDSASNRLSLSSCWKKELLCLPKFHTQQKLFLKLIKHAWCLSQYSLKNHSLNYHVCHWGHGRSRTFYPPLRSLLKTCTAKFNPCSYLLLDQEVCRASVPIVDFTVWCFKSERCWCKYKYLLECLSVSYSENVFIILFTAPALIKAVTHNHANQTDTEFF